MAHALRRAVSAMESGDGEATHSMHKVPDLLTDDAPMPDELFEVISIVTQQRYVRRTRAMHCKLAVLIVLTVVWYVSITHNFHAAGDNAVDAAPFVRYAYAVCALPLHVKEHYTFIVGGLIP